MNINFNRNRVQEYIESCISDFENMDSKAQNNAMKQYSLSHQDVLSIDELLKQDAVDYFFNSILSFCEGIDGIFEGRYSWATVKLYYSTFYALRSYMAADGYAIVSVGNIGRLENKISNCIHATANKKYKSTHGGTINHYIELYKDTDILLSNKIDDLYSYEWLKEIREIVNYRSVSFCETNNPLNIWDKVNEALNNGKINNLIDMIVSDESYIYCFQEEYAVIGISIIRMKLLIHKFIDKNLLNDIVSEKIIFLKQVLKYDERELALLQEIFLQP